MESLLNFASLCYTKSETGIEQFLNENAGIVLDWSADFWSTISKLDNELLAINVINVTSRWTIEIYNRNIFWNTFEFIENLQNINVKLIKNEKAILNEYTKTVLVSREEFQWSKVDMVKKAKFIIFVCETFSFWLFPL